MEVLYFQVGIFLIIVIAGLFGNSSRNTATILAIIFTIAMVFTSQLMIVQFITIVISYIVSRSISKNSKDKNLDDYEKYRQKNQNKTSFGDKLGCIFISLLALLTVLAVIIEKVR
ncbi:hypothetical protein NO995_09655 [Aestuariibaculum sp. M13]|uniref:hypothetical protein n=1 Tax=Aestuariibaculum sp. M13 TaxID=2967132 RepID=UPI002159F2F3|nr:hypothetical protein [Aestuariibaculum sp. M13]MCR8667946.1 hypothetical protein [Aestuariibaculum sp. M13]